MHAWSNTKGSSQRVWLSTLMEFRTVAVIMCSIYLVGIVALFWAPETKGQPLPED